MKIALCAIAGYENLYIREWVDYHTSLGFDKIIIYSNYPDENIDAILFDYIMIGKVDVISWYKNIIPEPGHSFQLDVQCPAYNDCLNKYRDDFDWIAFF